MNILHVITGLRKIAGTSTFCGELCNQLVTLGHDVTIAVRDPSTSDIYPLDPRVHLISIKSILHPPHEFSPSTYSLVHIHGLWSWPLHRVSCWSHTHNKPVVWSTHGMTASWALRHKWWKKCLPWYLYQKRDIKRAVMLHATSEMEAGWIRDLGFVQKLVVAPLGTHLPSSVPLRQHARKTILFVGRIYPVKGLMNLVKAWAQVRSSKVLKCESALVERPESSDQRTAAGKDASSFIANPSFLPNWQLVLAGPDQAGHKTELMAEAKKLGLSVADIPASQLIRQPASLPSPYDIVFTGPVYGADKDALYRMADLLVLPTYSENFGVVVIEALAQGCPVITTKGTPWQELLGQEGSNALRAGSKVPSVSGHVQGGSQVGSNSSFILHPSFLADNGRCGWWIDIGVEPLAEALREAMSLSDEERSAMGENGRRLVEDKYTWPAIAEQMRTAYHWMLNGGTPPACVRLV